jgi:transcriptional regulator with XRE-family HTH domain
MDAEMRTEGQRLLSEISGSEAELAAKIGCSPASIGHWRTGRRAPGQSARHKFDLLFGIPRLAWDVVPGGNIPCEPLEKPPKVEPTSGKAGTTLEITKSQIKNILDRLADDDSLIESESAKLRETLAKLLALRARLERDRDLLEDRFVREHPAWTRTRSAIVEALRPYPDAADAVVKVLG